MASLANYRRTAPPLAAPSGTAEDMAVAQHTLLWAPFASITPTVPNLRSIFPSCSFCLFPYRCQPTGSQSADVGLWKMSTLVSRPPPFVGWCSEFLLVRANWRFVLRGARALRQSGDALGGSWLALLRCWDLGWRWHNPGGSCKGRRRRSWL